MFNHNIVRKVCTIYWYGGIVLMMLFVLAIGQSEARTVEACSVENLRWNILALPDLSTKDGNSEFVLIQNTKGVPVQVQLIFFRNDGTCFIKHRQVGARETLALHADPDTLGQELSLVIKAESFDDFGHLNAEHSRYWNNFQGGSNAQATRFLTDSWLFAEGVFNSYFQEYIIVFSPNNQPATIQLELVKNGEVYRRFVPIPEAPGRRRIHLNTEFAGLSLDHSTKVSAFSADGYHMPIVVEREIVWDNGRDGSAEAGLLPSTRWYGAEGHNGWFNTYIFVANLENKDAEVVVTFYHEKDAPREITMRVPQKSRRKVELPSDMVGSFGFRVMTTNHATIAVERAMYWGDRWEGGHAGAASRIQSRKWLFAEGSTGFFQEFILLLNPDIYPTSATLRFLLDAVGSSQVVLGTDYPAPMILDDAVNWINSLPSLTADEKDAILSKNPARLLGI